MDTENILVKNLGKALNTKIKYVANASYLEVKENTKDKEKGIEIFYCLGIKMVFILNNDLKESILSFDYDSIETIYLDISDPDKFYINFRKASNVKPKQIRITTKFRVNLIKNTMCYYSIYHMNENSDIRDIDIKDCNFDGPVAKETKEQEKAEKNQDIRKYTVKNYDFYLKFKSKVDSNNYSFNVQYTTTENEEQESEVKKNKNLADGCQLTVEISDEYPISTFEVEKDEREISFYAYEHLLSYLANKKITKYFILNNKVYNKKFNLNGDKCAWEGWEFEIRAKEGKEIRNYIFVYLRRKFLPPYFDTFTNFHFILLEYAPNGSFELNPQAKEVIYTAANSIFYSFPYNKKENELFMRVKTDALLVDEETLYFYENNLGIVGQDVHIQGYTFLKKIIKFFEIYGEKAKSNKDELKKINIAIDNKLIRSNLGKIEEINEWVPPKGKDEFFKNLVGPFINLLQKDTETTNGEPIAEVKIDPKNKEAMKEMMEKEIWHNKVIRYLVYCINGGLSDYLFTFETFLTKLEKSGQRKKDFDKFTWAVFGLVIQKDENDEAEIGDSKDNKPDFNLLEKDKVHFTYNEEAVTSMIRKGYILRLLSSNLQECPSFIKVLIQNHCSNKLLSAVLDLLKTLSTQSRDDNSSGEREQFFSLLKGVLMDLFRDTTICPIKIVLVGKCLCTFINNDDKGNRIVLTQMGIVNLLAYYMKNFSYDENLVLCCLEIFTYIVPVLSITIKEILYDNSNGKLALLDIFKGLLNGTGIEGCHYSSRILVKLVTIFLNISNIYEAQLKDTLIQPQHRKIYSSFLNLTIDKKRKDLFNAKEEISHILELKVYWLMYILTFKNKTARDYLVKELNILQYIEDQSEKYNELIEYIIKTSGKNKDNKGYSDTKVDNIGKTIKKFCEFVYYLFFQEEEIKRLLSKKYHPKFVSLLKLYDDNREIISALEGEVFDVFIWFKKLEKQNKDNS